MKETQNTKTSDKEILINTLYTGDYTNKNIGHEIINLYKTDSYKDENGEEKGGENYIYISPYGIIHESRYEKVKDVLFARPAGKNRLEIIAKATGLESMYSDTLDNDSQIKEIYDEKYGNNANARNRFFAEKILEDKGMLDLDIDEIEQKLCLDAAIKKFNDEKEGQQNEKKRTIKKISDKFIMSRKIVTPREMRNLQNRFILAQLNKELNTVLESNGNSSKVRKEKEKFCAEKENYNNIKKEEYKIKKGIMREAEFLENCKKFIDGTNNSIDNDKLKEKFWETKYGKNCLKRYALNQHQKKECKKKKIKIKYGGTTLDEIYYMDENPNVFTFKSGSVQRPTKAIFIEYICNNKKENENNKNNTDSKNTGGVTKAEQSCCYIANDGTETSVTYKFKNIKFRNQSCLKYIANKNNEEDKGIQKMEFDDLKKPGEGHVYCVLKKIIWDESLWQSEGESTKPINVDEDSNEEPCFLERAGKQNDELAYSNMFAYFFRKYPNKFKILAEKLLLEEKFNIDDKDEFEVLREENNIDILIRTKNDIFVIENKIKSHINGEKYIDNYEFGDENEENDDKKEEINNNKQKDKGVEYTNQLIKYYNYVESIKGNKKTHYFIFKPKYNDTETELKEKIKNIDNKESIKKIVNKYKHINYGDLAKYLEDDNTKDEYYKDFIKALKLHESDIDNTIEKQMEYKFRQAILKATNKS